MIIFALLVAVVACSNAALLPSVRIVGGTSILIEEAPWQVALLYDSNNSGLYYQVCGGVIISKTSILSSAQCVYKTDPSQWRVRSGSSYRNNGGEVIQVSDFVIHDLYDSKTFANDLVILHLDNPITLGTNAKTATLPAQGLQINDNTPCVVTGWGKLSEGGSTPTQLQKITVPAVNQQQCVSAYSGFNTITSNMFCAGRIGVGGMDSCQGDTGGPLMIDNLLMGITSWTKGCGEPQYPGVYTRVSMYRIWINDNM